LDEWVCFDVWDVGGARWVRRSEDDWRFGARRCDGGIDWSRFWHWNIGAGVVYVKGNRVGRRKSRGVVRL
jgi:hypothetical protein